MIKSPKYSVLKGHKQETLEEFGISTQDLNKSKPHKIDHVGKNVKLASVIRKQKVQMQLFQRSILNKNNKKNLEIIVNESKKKVVK